ncbi:hypothetical protein KKC13_07215 [bacterium]|nr:hypothetical protein [bacterium]MBU1956927.1 hypothetical protein [bacterium]
MKYEHLVLWETLHTETVTCRAERAYLADEVFTMLQNAYKNVQGGLHFSCADELVSNTAVWKVIYYQENIVGVVVYKAKRGLKMVALALSHQLNRPLKEHTKTMLSYLFKITFNNTWMEVSESAERFIVANGGAKYFISNSHAQKLTGKEIVMLCDDGYHYKRVINGVLKTKVMVGNPKF